jgi:hypothetical protein
LGKEGQNKKYIGRDGQKRSTFDDGAYRKTALRDGAFFKTMEFGDDVADGPEGGIPKDRTTKVFARLESFVDKL